MCIKFFAITISVILLLIISLVSCELEQRFLDSVQHPALAQLVKMRCTRRFSPGVCVDDVAPVWTFVFLQQNCIERLGCPNNYRTNRFRSYRMCMKRCHALVDMYLKMVEIEERNADSGDDAGDGNDTDDRNLREGLASKQVLKYRYFWEPLPFCPPCYNYKYIIATGFQKDPLSVEDLTEDTEEEEYKEGNQDTRFIVYKDSNVNEDIMPADVDYVPGEIRSEIDVQHY